jgi:uncharacterized protein
VKLLVAERGSAEAIAVWLDADRVVSSRLLYVEARAAIGRAVRTRRLGGGVAHAASALAERLWRDIDRIDVSDSLTRSAGDLAESQRLRAYDAVHLASALSIADRNLVVVAADLDLLATAHSLDVATIRLVG